MPDAEAYDIRPVEASEWDRFQAAAIGATPFSSRSWLDCAAAASDAETVMLGAYHRDQLVAGVAGCRQGRGWRRRYGTPDLLPHTGLLFRPSDTVRPAHLESERNGAAQALIGHLQSTGPQIHLAHAPAVTDPRPFLWSGWEVVPRSTYWIDLPATRTDVWDGFERRTRTAIRKAEKAGYRLDSAHDSAELRRLYGQVYGGEDHAPVAGSVVEAMAGRALEEGLARGHRVVSSEGDTAAVVLFAQDDTCLYAWVAGADPAHRDSGAASLLYWKVIEQTERQRFDFVGANLPSVALFKRGFGGQLVTYYATSHCSSRLLRAARAWRRVVGR